MMHGSQHGDQLYNCFIISNIPCRYICFSVKQGLYNFMEPSQASIVKCSVTPLVSKTDINWPEYRLYIFNVSKI